MLKKLFKLKDYKNQIWKNGLGKTAQIDIEPDSENFIWRLSMAQVEATSPFSIYTGYDRLLSVWQGNGMILNQMHFSQFEVHRFSGEESITCIPLSPQIMDIGLIFNRDLVKADMQFKTGTGLLHLRDGLHFIFCVQGSFICQGFSADTGDTLKIEGAGGIIELNKTSKTELKYYVISVVVLA